MTGDDKMPCFDMLHWLLRLGCHQVVCDEWSAPSSSCRHWEIESELCLWQGRKSGLLIYVYIFYFFTVERTCSLITFCFPFYFFFPKFAYVQCYQNCEFLKDWAGVLSLAGLAFVTVIKGTFGGSASTGPGSDWSWPCCCWHELWGRTGSLQNISGCLG